MALNDTVIKAAKPRQKNWKLADEKGLYLLITPAGGKLWRVKFRHHGKEKKLSLGAYPAVGLAKARKLRDAAREQLAEGQDQGALITPKARHYAAILEPAKLGELLRAIEAFSGSPVTMAALRIAPHVFVRPGELRHAEWSEFDLKQGIWNIPAGKMKARRPHAVPLSKQVCEMLKDLRVLSGHGKYVLPISMHPRPISLDVRVRKHGVIERPCGCNSF